MFSVYSRSFFSQEGDQWQDRLFVRRDPRRITLLGLTISGTSCQCTEVSQIPFSSRDRQIGRSTLRMLLREGSRCFPLGLPYCIGYLMHVSSTHVCTMHSMWCTSLYIIRNYTQGNRCR